jgi:uncharacterized protein with HEPN domain
MSRHDPLLRVRHMLDHANEAMILAHGHSRDDLDSNRLLNLALTRLLEVIGEAAAQLPDSLKVDHPTIPWREVTGLRNRLIHEYDEVDLDILWTIVQDDLPPLAKQLAAMLPADQTR